MYENRRPSSTFQMYFTRFAMLPIYTTICSVFEYFIISCRVLTSTCKLRFVNVLLVQRKDEYGNEVQRVARPLPIEYLLVDMPCGTPLDPEYSFCSRGSVHLAIENRAPSMPAQDVRSFSHYISATLPALFSSPASLSPLQILQALSDFHVLFFLASNEFVPFEVLKVYSTIRSFFGKLDSHREYVAAEFILEINLMRRATN